MEQATDPQDDLTLVLGAWLDARRRRSVEPIAKVLDADVVWQGLAPEYICRSREEVVQRLQMSKVYLSPLTAFEGRVSGDQVTLIGTGPAFLDPVGVPRPQAGIVFTVRDGMVVRMDALRV
jgi:hypothetical protein